MAFAVADIVRTLASCNLVWTGYNVTKWYDLIVPTGYNAWQVQLAQKKELIPNMDATSKLASMLRALRDANNFTQEKLAALSGLSRVQIARLETGKRGKKLSFETVAKLAKAFGMSAEDFMKAASDAKPVAKKRNRGKT